MQSDLLLFLFTPNLISILIWTIVTIILIPDRPFFGLLLWLFISSLTIFYFPSSQPYTDKGVADAVGEAILYIIVLTIIISFSIWIIIIIINIINSPKKSNQEKSIEVKIFNQIILVAYGLLLGFWIFLFFAKFLEEYQPAWEAYIIVALFSILFLFLFRNIKKHQKYCKHTQQKQIDFFAYSLLTTIISLLIISFSFSIIAIAETKKIVQQYQDREIKYCIQNLELNTWLDLTPLVAWKKATIDWGAGINHAVLVIQTSNSIPDLYNWSYKLKTWDYSTKGFKPSAFTSPSSLKCVLKKDYINKIPFIIPKNNQFYIEEQIFNIPYRYFPQQKNYKFNNPLDRSSKPSSLEFIASIPNFYSIKQIFTKLPKQYNFSTSVSVYVLSGRQDLENRLNIYPKAKFQKLKSQYGLKKRVYPQKKYSEQKISYYQKIDETTTTLIECLPTIKNKLNCQHYFVYKNFIFSFSHSNKDLKNWRKLQIKLINKVESWQNINR